MALRMAGTWVTLLPIYRMLFDLGTNSQTVRPELSCKLLKAAKAGSIGAS